MFTLTYRNADGTVDPARLQACIRSVLAADDLEPLERGRLLAKFSALAASRDFGRPSNVSVQASAQGVTIDVFGAIGEDWYGEGLTTRRVADVLKQTTGTITLRINSGGGDAFEGDAIHSLLAAAPNRVEVEILALCASAATVIAMAADEVRISETGVFMIHDATVMTVGGLKEHRSALQILEGLNEGVAKIYAARTKRDAGEMRDLMAAESWLTAQEAFEKGFVDRITVGARAAAAAVDVSRAPAAVRALLNNSARGTCTPMKELLARLGLAEDATEDQIVAALDAALAAASAVTPEPAAPAAAPEPVAPAAPPAAAVAAVQSPEMLAELHSVSAAALVDRFIAEGVIPPAARAKALSACGSTAAQLNACASYWGSLESILPKRVAPAATAPAAPGARTAPAAREVGDKPTPRQARMCRDAGITWEQFKATGERLRESGQSF